MAPIALEYLVLDVSSRPNTHAACTGAMNGLKAGITYSTHWPMRTWIGKANPLPE